MPADTRAGLQPVRVRHRATPPGGGALRTSTRAIRCLVRLTQAGIDHSRSRPGQREPEPPVDPGQRVQLLLYGTANFTIDATARTAAADEVEFDTSAVSAGTYCRSTSTERSRLSYSRPPAPHSTARTW
jgi:hypothetical protein